MRILVTGSRDWTDGGIIAQALLDVLSDFPDATEYVVIDGKARGADTIANRIGVSMGMRPDRFPAEWSLHGKRAGPIRNQQMVDVGADICLAFPTKASRGTWDCVKRANGAGIPVRIYHPDGRVEELA